MQSINLIAINPKIRRGRAHIVGTTVTVADVVIASVYHQQDANSIADWYSLSLPQVYAALSYYHDHQIEMDEQIAVLIRHAEELEDNRVGNEGSLLP